MGFYSAATWKLRDWLRDEFEFRCVFCLSREAWGTFVGVWDIDHLLPRVIRPDLALEYDNLLYACHGCNLCKRAHIFPDPSQQAYGQHLRVDHDGKIHGKTPEGRRMIRLLKLDRSTARRYRWLKIREERSLAQTDPEAHRVFMGYPDELPDIEALDKEVPRNNRSAGVAESCLARRKRGVLPETY